MIQLKYVGVLLLFGGLMGTVFDFYNTITGASKWLRWLRPTLDLVFWGGAAVGVYYVLFVVDQGRVRLYTFALLVVGYAVYRLVLHERVVGSAFAVVRVVSRWLRFFYRILYVLLLRPLQLILSAVWILLTKFYALLCWGEDAVFWLLRFWLKLFTRPLRGRGLRVAKLGRFLSTYWEGICDRASKWVKQKTVGT
ncbi:MAG: hypothetical protein A2201_13600 [Alicyclobacillus sp. RIFOXYA1_FULL_53_8]|nr:MAG: hypothetical protein A2201_13600 [Alicyclobacillus sp. RIFOXYA1_FULL_53_8]